MPEVMIYWKDVVFLMDYKIHEVKAMAKDGQDSTEQCLSSFRIGLIQYKSWLCTKILIELLEKIKNVDELIAAAECIDK